MTAVEVARLDGGRVTIATEDLAARLSGRVLQPADEDWDAAVRLWNASVVKAPALVG